MNSAIFWDVDTQVDFISPGGKLYVPGAEAILPNLARLTSWAKENGILIVASTDAHFEHDAEFKLYPPHCVIGTPGQQKVRETHAAKQLVIPNRPVQLPVSLSEYEQIIFEKQYFDVFTNPNIEALLQRLGRRNVILYGVVTEICVAAAARGLLERGWVVSIVQDAIRCLDEAKGGTTLEEIQQRGGKLVTTEQVFRTFHAPAPTS